MKNCLLIIYFLPIIVFAQSNDNHGNSILNKLSIQGMYQNGYVFPTNDFIRGNNTEMYTINAFQVFSIKLSRQTKGEKLWE